MDVVVGRLEVHVDDGVPLGLVHTEHQAVARDAGVVHQHVDVAEIRENLLHGLVRLREIGGVGCIRAHLDAERFQLLDSIFDDLDVGECDVRPFGGEF